MKIHPDDIGKNVYDIDDVRKVCGYRKLIDDCPPGWYPCTNKENEYIEEYEDSNGETKEVRCCYTFSCPLGYEPDHDETVIILYDEKGVFDNE